MKATPTRTTCPARQARAVPALVGLAAALALASSTTPAHAQERLRQSAQPAPPANKEGDYGGVTPGKTTLKGKARKNQLTWLGFQPTSDGRARLFVQLSSEVEYRQEVREGALYVKLEGVTYRDRNARRRLDMRFFETPIMQVTSRYQRKRRARKNKPAQTAGVELRIQFKNPGDAREARADLSAAEDGFHYLLLDFDPSGAAGSRPDDLGDLDDE